MRRLRRIFLAYATSGVSKLATAGVQLLALPIVLAAAGSEKFGAMMTVAAMGSLLQFPALGFSSSVGYLMSSSIGHGDETEAAKWLRSALIVVAGIAALLLTAGLILIGFLPVHAFLGEGVKAFPAEARAMLLAALVHTIGVYLFNMVEGVRASFHENFITNLYSSAGSGLSFVAVLLVARVAPSLPHFYLALFALPVFVQGLNLTMFALGRSKAFRGNLARGAIDPMPVIAKAVSYAKAQAGIVLHLHGFTYLVSHMIGLTAGGAIGAAIRALVLLASFAQSLLNPVFPVISQALVRLDATGFKRYYLAAVAFSASYALAVGATFAVAGNHILELWLSISIPGGEPVLLGMGLLAAGYLGGHLLFNILVYVGQSKYFGYSVGLSGIAGFAISYFLLGRAGMSSALIANASILFVTAYCLQLIWLFRFYRSAFPALPLATK